MPYSPCVSIVLSAGSTLIFPIIAEQFSALESTKALVFFKNSISGGNIIIYGEKILNKYRTEKNLAFLCEAMAAKVPTTSTGGKTEKLLAIAARCRTYF